MIVKWSKLARILFTGGKRYEKNVIKCQAGNQFQLEGEVGPLYDFQCSEVANSVLKQSGQCSLNKTRLLSGFQVMNTFIPLVEICFDEMRLRTLYTKHNITEDIQGRQHDYPRKTFAEGLLKVDIPRQEQY